MMGIRYYGDWDLASVMNYCNPNWNGNGQLSDTDIAAVRYYYGAPPWSGSGFRGFGWSLGDFDGDGMTDLLRQYNKWGGGEILLSTGSGFSNPTHWTGSGHGGYGWRVGDFDGDNKSDLLRSVGTREGTEVLLSPDNSFSAPSRWADDVPRTAGWYVGKFNNDIRVDVLREHNKWGGAEVFVSTGTSFNYGLKP